jgi:uncharacterized protein
VKTVVAALFLVILVGSYCAAQDGVQRKDATTSKPASTSEPANVNPQKEADIRRLMSVTGAAGLGVATMSNMETSMRPLLEKSMPPGEYRARLIELFFQKFHAEATQESLTNLVIPIYDRHFSDDEIKGLIAFYETPLGKKSISVLPQVVSEAQQAGGAWGSELGRRCMQEVLTEHPDLARQLEDAQKLASPD